MSSNRRKFQVKHPVVVDIGCSCRRPKLSSFFLSSFKKPHKNNNNNNNYPSVFSPSTASLTTTAATTNASSSSSFSPSNFTSSSSPSQAFKSPKQSSRRRRRKKEGAQQQQQQLQLVEESVAVEKESSDPYVDFRDSMLQMIVEKEIYGWEELRELLQLFLSLNSPYHHHLILQAFAEIWNGVFSPGQ